MRALHVLDTQHIDIDSLHVASPCTAKWKDMRGDDRARLCLACDKHVYNLSSMTRTEIETLIVATEGQFCRRLYKRKDGTVLTADCPLGVRERVGIAAHRVSLTVLLAAMAVVLAILALVPRSKTCVVSSTGGASEPALPPVKHPTVEVIESGLSGVQAQAREQLQRTYMIKGG